MIRKVGKLKKLKVFSLFKACRPRQWSKNLIVFAAPLFSFNYSLEIWYPCLLATISFCFISSSIYLLNDCLDIESDKKHPNKCKRPIAAGIISLKTAYILSFFLALISFLISSSLNLGLFFIILFYYLIQIFYCKYLKNQALIDLFCISSGFLLRSMAGILASNLYLSPWFILSVGLLALFLAVEKRKAELMIVNKTGVFTRKVLRFYSLPLLLRLENTLTTSSFMSYSLWASGPILNGSPTSLMLITVPLVLVGIFRYQLLSDPEEAARRNGNNISFITEKPEAVLLGDPGIRLIVFVWILITIIIGFLSKL